MVSGIYSGTAMLNRLLERKGRRVGLIVTGGMEDVLRLERGIQTYLGYPYSDRLHVATHYHNEPLVPRKRITRRAGRIDLFGDEAIPLYEDEARAAVEELRDAGVEGIVVNLLYSYRNSCPRGPHARDRRRGRRPRCRCFFSSELYPMRRDFPRLNSTLIEAYAAEPSREQLSKVREVTREAGARFDLRIMAAHGGTISIDARRAGADADLRADRRSDRRALPGRPDAERDRDGLGQNIVCTDIGGTSFDIALITDGEFNDQADAGHRPLHAQPAARPGRLDRRRHRLVRAHRPELGPARARPRLRRGADRRLLARGRPRDADGHRPATWCSAASTPTTSSAAR